MQRITKTLIRLRGCAGSFASLLCAYGTNRFSHDEADVKCRPDVLFCYRRIYDTLEFSSFLTSRMDSFQNATESEIRYSHKYSTGQNVVYWTLDTTVDSRYPEFQGTH